MFVWRRLQYKTKFDYENRCEVQACYGSIHPQVEVKCSSGITLFLLKCQTKLDIDFSVDKMAAVHI